MVQNLFHVRDEKTGSGGSGASGVNIRDLNTVLTNEISGASLSANQFVLPAGTYEISGRAPAYRSNEHRVYLYNITDAAIELYGRSCKAYNHADSQRHTHTPSEVRGRFTTIATKTFELRHNLSSSGFYGGTSGLGVSTGDGEINVYADVEIREIIADLDLLHVRDEKSANTSGGTSVGGWQVRALNTVKTNEISGASLASNKITLPAGEYIVEASAPCHRGNNHRISLYNETKAKHIITGVNARQAGSFIFGSNDSYLDSQFILHDTADLELWHNINTAITTFGLGVDSNDGSQEVYSEVLIRKIT